jgi:hypothetical protein
MFKFFGNLLSKKYASIRKPYGYEMPDFFIELSENFDLISEEWRAFVANTNSKGVAIDELSEVQKELNLDKKWQSLILYGYSYYNNTLTGHFPYLFEFAKRNQSQINLIMFSTTEAGKVIPSHHGNNHGVLRLQLGIDIKHPEECYLRVEDKNKCLKEKEIFIFDDTFEHELVNNSKSHRTVLIVDFLKPLPFFYHKLNKLKIKEMQKSDYVQSVVKKF